MTAPRQLFEGKTYLVSRRCSERRFFLRPSKETNAIVRFVLAVVAERYGVLLHAFCVMSNHLHIVLTDPRARLPEFHRDLDSLLARAVNCALGRWEGFWDRDSYSAVRLETREAIVEKLVYVLANPVSACLVRRAVNWPGVWSDGTLLRGEPLRCERPKGFFRETGPMPASATLQLRRPPGFEQDEGFVDELLRQLGQAEDAAAAELSEAGRSFVGASRALSQRPDARPAPGEPRRGLNPRVACRNKWKRIEVLQRLREFVRDHREAFKQWQAGAREVVFPAGTWLMRVFHGVQSAAPA